MTFRMHRNLETEFKELFGGAPCPGTKERIGVMSIDSLTRQWIPVADENGYLVAKSKDGRAALIGRMCRRDDGKLCIEIAVRTAIEHDELRRHEFWHANLDDGPRFARRLDEVMQEHISKFRREDN